MEWKKEKASFALQMKKVPTTFIMPLGQWFSTFLRLLYTNFENKFCGTPKCKKRHQNDENIVVFEYFLRHFRIWRHTCVFYGTPVDKHCPRVWMLTYQFNF